MSDSTCEAQRQAVAIADYIGGNLDTTTSVCHGPTGIAFEGVGESTATLGEIKNRADLLIFWGGNPAESHPRLFTRYALMPKGLHIPNGKKDRTAVLIDVRRSPSVPVAEHGEVLALVERRRLMGTGIGWVDAHLLASALLARVRLWTLDQGLARQARRLGVAAE